MHHSPKCKMKDYKTPRRYYRITFNDCGLSDDFLDTTSEHSPWSKELISWTYLKFKTSAVWKTLLREWKGKPHVGKKYFQKIW